jgi:hypothetical protein
MPTQEENIRDNYNFRNKKLGWKKYAKKEKDNSFPLKEISCQNLVSPKVSSNFLTPVKHSNSMLPIYKGKSNNTNFVSFNKNKQRKIYVQTKEHFWNNVRNNNQQNTQKNTTIPVIEDPELVDYPEQIEDPEQVEYPEQIDGDIIYLNKIEYNNSRYLGFPPGEELNYYANFLALWRHNSLVYSLNQQQYY